MRAEDGRLLGTICAASAAVKPLSAEARAAITLFSSLVAGFIEREMLMRELQDANQSLRDVALRDALTGLPNRRALYETLDMALARAAASGDTVLVGLMDLDGFKQINDTHGHQTGDALLCALGRRVAGACAPATYWAGWAVMNSCWSRPGRLIAPRPTRRPTCCSGACRPNR